MASIERNEVQPHFSTGAAAITRISARRQRRAPIRVIEQSHIGQRCGILVTVGAADCGLGVGASVLMINTILWLLRGQALWFTALSIIANIGAWIWLIMVVRRQIEKVRSFRAGC